MLEGIEFSLAVDIADDKAPKPDEDRDWDKALKEYKVEKLTRGTGIKESTWKKEHEPVIKDAIALMTGRNSPKNPAELINKTTEDWEIGSRTRQQRARNLAAFLKYCVNVQRFPEYLTPPTDLSYHIGRKTATSRSQKVHPVTDQEIIDLIDSLENFDGLLRDKPAALNWARAIKLLAAFGLRPEELKHLEKRVDKKTKEEYLWCSYQKRAGGGMTQPRRLYPLYPINKKGVKQDWNLVALFATKGFWLPPLQSKNGVGEACVKYLRRRKGWQKLIKKVEKRNERAGSYSFRHSYSVRGHELDINGGSMATAMGHSYETHCREYPWASKSGTTAEFERVNSK
ncbi:putative phage integrase family [Prochlorococcus sp. MIT 0602]|nr:putative phage integrase family [Prochlorococcus sp. MIT 0602]KGG17199.1 putative phage integrase family [Prochlorococcus sp. MIT 0603]